MRLELAPEIMSAVQAEELDRLILGSKEAPPSPEDRLRLAHLMMGAYAHSPVSVDEYIKEKRTQTERENAE